MKQASLRDALSLGINRRVFHQVSVFSLQGLDAQIAVRAFAISALVMVLTMPVCSATCWIDCLRGRCSLLLCSS